MFSFIVCSCIKFMWRNDQLIWVYYFNHSLPSPMRPSRSHESLASPLKPSNSNQLCAEQPTQFVKSSSIKSRLKLIGQHQTPSKSLRSHTATSNTTTTNSNSLQHEVVFKLKLANANDSSPVLINSIHTSLFNKENCFEIKCTNSAISITNDSPDLNQFDYDSEYNDEDDYLDYECANEESRIRQRSRRLTNRTAAAKCVSSSEVYSSRYFLCRSVEERDKWMQCLKSVVTQPYLISEQRHDENSLQVWLLEAKGQAISSKPTKKYFCEVFLNNILHAKTCSKEKKEILFWGESFDFK